MEKAVIEIVLFLIEEETGVKVEPDGCESSLCHEYGIDSLCMTNIVLALEELFDINISDEDCEKLISVNDIVNFIKHKKAPDVDDIQENFAQYKKRNKRRDRNTIQNIGLSAYFQDLHRQLA